MFRCLPICIVFTVLLPKAESALCQKSNGGTYNLECPLEKQWCCAIDNYNDRCCTLEEFEDQNQFDDIAEGLVNVIVGVVVGSIFLVTILLCCCCCLPFCFCAKARKRRQGRDRGRNDADGDNAMNQGALPIQQNHPLVNNPQYQSSTHHTDDSTIYHPHVTVGGPGPYPPQSGPGPYPPLSGPGTYPPQSGPYPPQSGPGPYPPPQDYNSPSGGFPYAPQAGGAYPPAQTGGYTPYPDQPPPYTNSVAPPPQLYKQPAYNPNAF